jgi:hypothetical protein
MEVGLAVIGVALLVLVAIGEPVAELFAFLLDVGEGLKSNRNDRGMYKKPSAKHII